MRRAWEPVAALAVVLLAFALGGARLGRGEARLLPLPSYPGTRLVPVGFRAADGKPETMIVEVPSWYGPLDHPALPLVVSPHTRASNPFMTAAHWRGLPGRCRIIVLDAGLSGRVTQTRSWGWPPEIAEITRLPGIARRLVPYLRYDPNRVYLAGDSMGGQEVLLALERRPDLFAAAVASDPATNMLRRWYQFPHSVASRGQQAALTREVGVAPSTKRWLYVRRSPFFFARTLAFSGVPVELWWNPADPVIVDASATQTGVFIRAVRKLNPHAPLVSHIHHHLHGWPFAPKHKLPAMVRFLLAHRRHLPPDGGFSYVSWLPRVSVWGWRIDAGGNGRSLWQLDSVTRRGFRSISSNPLTVRPPGPPLAGALVDGKRVQLQGGAALLPPGQHSVSFLP
jgi:pimeloyl-ACP methyl ester carboxylesterase